MVKVCSVSNTLEKRFRNLKTHDSLFSCFILLLSRRPMFSLCSVYSCLMSSRTANIFRGFLEDWTFLAGRTARLCCTISEVNLTRSRKMKGSQSYYFFIIDIQCSGFESCTYSSSMLPGHLCSKDGIKIVIDFHLAGDLGHILCVPIKLIEGFIIQGHDLLNRFLCDRNGGLLKTWN